MTSMNDGHYVIYTTFLCATLTLLVACALTLLSGVKHVGIFQITTSKPELFTFFLLAVEIPLSLPVNTKAFFLCLQASSCTKETNNVEIFLIHSSLAFKLLRMTSNLEV